MTTHNKVVVTQRIESFTFDLPFPVCKAGAPQTGLAGFLAGCVVPNYTTDERWCDLMQVDLTYDRVAYVELVEGVPGRSTPAIRIRISPDGIDDQHLEELTDPISTLLGDDFQPMCAHARAVAMTVSVELENVTFDRVLPRLDAPGQKVKELRTLAEDGRLKRIRFKTKPHAHQPPTSARGMSDGDALQEPCIAASCVVGGDTLIEHKGKRVMRGGSLSLQQHYALDMPLTELGGMHGGIHRIRFAEAPFENPIGLPLRHSQEFLELIRAKGVNVAIARSVAWDGGQAAERWWKVRQPEWWKPTKVWDECVADLPRIGKFIAAGFRQTL